MPFKCLILMTLTMAKYYENLIRDSPLSLLFIVKFFASLETKMILKMPNETFLRITRYLVECITFYNKWLVTTRFSTQFYKDACYVMCQYDIVFFGASWSVSRQRNIFASLTLHYSLDTRLLIHVTMYGRWNEHGNSKQMVSIIKTTTKAMRRAWHEVAKEWASKWSKRQSCIWI